MLKRSVVRATALSDPFVRPGLLAFLATFSITSPSTTSAQERQIKEGVPRPIALQPVVTIRDDGPGGAVHSRFTIAMDSSRRYWVSSHMARGAIDVFSNAGLFLHRIEPETDGADQFGYVRNVVWGQGGMNVHDEGANVVRVMDESLRVLSETPLPENTYDVGVLRGLYAVSSEIRSPSRVGFPLHLIEPSGSVTRSLGKGEKAYVAGTNLNRAISVRADTLWTTAVDDYVIEAYAREGTVTFRARRPVDWLSPSPAPKRRGEAHPRAGILDLRARKDGFLMVLLERPDPQWERGVEWSADRSRYAIVDWHRYVDTVVELIDTRGGEVIASSRFDQRIARIVNDDFVASFEDGVGIRIWRATIGEPRQEEEYR